MTRSFGLTRRFGPGLLAAGIAIVYLIVLTLAPQWAVGGCMESYPMQCEVVTVVPGGLAGTAAALAVCIVAIVWASGIRKPRTRTIAIAACFVVLASAMIVGANLSLLFETETRY